ncbi:unnamed protein product [Paramecium sonneborni]|uniref:Uncharacterized protein n=1 Tax=Paramecium sonneborni TaxID=65129 RepID=A0A8S1QVN8_9CILI|nr:unnamed protein product [Paramecium sonneborni]
MKFSFKHEKLSKNQIALFQRLIQILEKRAVMINFDYIKTYSIIKKRISNVVAKEILQLNQRSYELHSIQSINGDNQKGSLVRAIQELKIKNITQQINESQYTTSNTKEELRKIIELDRRRKCVKLNLKDNQIVPKSNEEKIYEACLAVIFITFFFALFYTMVHEFKN